MKKTIKAMITGKAIYPVSTDELKALLGDSHSTLRLTAEPSEAVEEFMKRAFSNALSIEHVAQSTWQCIIYISPNWQKLSEDAINELETYIDRWCMDSEKQVSWGAYEDTSLHSPEILIIANKAADTEASDEVEDLVNSLIIKDYVKIDNDIQEEIKQQLKENLLKTNKQISKEEAEEKICNTYVPDGIMNNGEYYIDEVGHVRRAPSGYENVVLDSLKHMRIVYITKELNAGKDKNDTYDIRQDSFCEPVNYIDEHNFSVKLEDVKGLNKMIAYTFHGIIQTLAHHDKPFLEFEKIGSDEVLKTIMKYTFARINVKSTGGSNQSNDKEVLREAEKCSSYTIKRIRNLDPKVIVCCGNQNNHNFILEDFLNKFGFHFEWTDIPGVWIDKEYGIIAIDSYHLSYVNYGYSEKKLYDDIVKSLYKYVVRNPEIIEYDEYCK